MMISTRSWFIIENYHNFERTENRATVSLKWTNFMWFHAQLTQKNLEWYLSNNHTSSFLFLLLYHFYTCYYLIWKKSQSTSTIYTLYNVNILSIVWYKPSMIKEKRENLIITVFRILKYLKINVTQTLIFQSGLVKNRTIFVFVRAPF